MNVEREPGEQVVRKSRANQWRGAEAVGGQLLLTDRRLVFSPHRVNLNRDLFAVPITDIRAVTLSTRANSVAVQLADGRCETFVVFRRRTWAAAILEAASGGSVLD